MRRRFQIRPIRGNRSWGDGIHISGGGGYEHDGQGPQNPPPLPRIFIQKRDMGVCYKYKVHTYQVNVFLQIIISWTVYHIIYGVRRVSGLRREPASLREEPHTDPHILLRKMIPTLSLQVLCGCSVNGTRNIKALLWLIII